MTPRCKPVKRGRPSRRIITVKLAILIGVMSFIYSLFYWQTMFDKEVSADSLEGPGHHRDATGQMDHPKEECSSKI